MWGDWQEKKNFFEEAVCSGTMPMSNRIININQVLRKCQVLY